MFDPFFGRNIDFCDVTDTVVPAATEKMETSLHQWISKERFVAFPKVTGVGLNEMASLGKLLAIFVLDEKNSETEDERLR